MNEQTHVRGPASHFPSIERTYGRPVAERLTNSHMELVGWLKAEHGLGHGHANALVGFALAQRPAQQLAQPLAQPLAKQKEA